MTCDDPLHIAKSYGEKNNLPDDLVVRCVRLRGHPVDEYGNGHVGSFADRVFRW